MNRVIGIRPESHLGEGLTFREEGCTGLGNDFHFDSMEVEGEESRESEPSDELTR
jgi:hypothetical protein